MNTSIHRTDYQKYTHYMSDGYGRDKYILQNNGGLCKQREPAFQESSRYVMPKLHFSPHPLKEATCFKYPSDGSGRDSYILYNSGGLHADYVPGGQSNTFYNSLRKHEKLPDVRKRSNSNKRFIKRNSDAGNSGSPERQLQTDFEDWQAWNPALQTVQFKRMKHHQQLQSERLSIPRDHRLHYKRWKEATEHVAHQSFGPRLKQQLLIASEPLSMNGGGGLKKKHHQRAFSSLKDRIQDKLTKSGREASPQRGRLADSPNRLHVSAALGIDSASNLKSEIRRHKESVLRQIREIQAGSARKYKYIEQQREINKGLSPRNEVFSTHEKYGTLAPMDHRVKEGAMIPRSITNLGQRERNSHKESRSHSPTQDYGEMGGGGFKRRLTALVPSSKTNAFTKSEEEERDLKDIEKELMEQKEVVLRKNNEKRNPSPRAQTVLAHYQ